MTRISSLDKAILKKLIASGVINAEKADDLIQALDLHRVEDPDHCITDLLIEHKLLAPSQVNALIASVEDSPAAKKQKNMTSTAPQRHRPARHHHAPFQPKDRSASLYVTFAFVIILLAGAVYLIWDQSRDDSTDIAAKPTDVQTNVADDASKTIDDPEITAFEVEKKFRALEFEPDLLRKIDGLAGLSVICPDAELKSRIDGALAKAEGMRDQSAQAELTRLQPEIEGAISNGDLRKALGIYRDLVARFGTGALRGALQHHVNEIQDGIQTQVNDYLDSGKLAYEEKNYAEARAAFDAIREIGDDGNIADAERWLRKIDAKEEEGDIVEASDKDDGKAKVEAASADADSGAESESDEVISVDVYKRRKAVKELAGRIDEIFNGNAEIDANGMLTVSYNFESKNDAEAKDWLPDIEGGRFEDKVRWTMVQEEVVVGGATGVRVSDRGVFRHKAKIQAPIKVSVRYHPTNQFWPRNVCALAWIKDNGTGICTNFGKQTGQVSKFKVGKLQPPQLTDITCLQTYELTLEIDEGNFTGAFRGSRTNPRKTPDKLTSGYFALVWNDKIAATVKSISISGAIDPDWLMDQLK